MSLGKEELYPWAQTVKGAEAADGVAAVVAAVHVEAATALQR